MFFQISFDLSLSLCLSLCLCFSLSLSLYISLFNLLEKIQLSWTKRVLRARGLVPLNGYGEISGVPLTVEQGGKRSARALTKQSDSIL